MAKTEPLFFCEIGWAFKTHVLTLRHITCVVKIYTENIQIWWLVHSRGEVLEIKSYFSCW